MQTDGQTTLYDILGVPPDSDAPAVRRAYQALRRRHHPAMQDTPGSERVLKQIARAYAILGNPAERAEYDNRRRGAEGMDEPVLMVAAAQATTTVAAEPAPAPANQLVVKPAGLTLNAVPAGAINRAELRVHGEGGPARGTATPRQSWITIDQTQFTGDTTLRVLVDCTTMSQGETRYGSIQVTAENGGTLVVPVIVSTQVTETRRSSVAEWLGRSHHVETPPRIPMPQASATTSLPETTPATPPPAEAAPAPRVDDSWATTELLVPTLASPGNGAKQDDANLIGPWTWAKEQESGATPEAVAGEVTEPTVVAEAGEVISLSPSVAEMTTEAVAETPEAAAPGTTETPPEAEAVATEAAPEVPVEAAATKPTTEVTTMAPEVETVIIEETSYLPGSAEMGTPDVLITTETIYTHQLGLPMMDETPGEPVVPAQPEATAAVTPPVEAAPATEPTAAAMVDEPPAMPEAPATLDAEHAAVLEELKHTPVAKPEVADWLRRMRKAPAEPATATPVAAEAPAEQPVTESDTIETSGEPEAAESLRETVAEQAPTIAVAGSGELEPPIAAAETTPAIATTSLRGGVTATKKPSGAKEPTWKRALQSGSTPGPAPAPEAEEPEQTTETETATTAPAGLAKATIEPAAETPATEGKEGTTVRTRPTPFPPASAVTLETKEQKPRANAGDRAGAMAAGAAHWTMTSATMAGELGRSVLSPLTANRRVNLTQLIGIIMVVVGTILVISISVRLWPVGANHGHVIRATATATPAAATATPTGSVAASLAISSEMPIHVNVPSLLSAPLYWSPSGNCFLAQYKLPSSASGKANYAVIDAAPGPTMGQGTSYLIGSSAVFAPVNDTIAFLQVYNDPENVLNDGVRLNLESLDANCAAQTTTSNQPATVLIDTTGTHSHGIIVAAGDNNLAWTTDGTAVDFRGTNLKTGASGIYQVPAAGGTPKLLVSDYRGGHAVVPLGWLDRSHLLYGMHWTAGATGWVMAIYDGANTTVLSATWGYLGTPTWSPDGRYLAYTGSNAAHTGTNIYMLDVYNTDLPYQILTNGPNDQDPTFAPQGLILAYAHAEAGQNAMATVLAQPLDPQSAQGVGRPATMSNADVSAGASAWSSDGHRLAYIGTSSSDVTQVDIYIVTLTSAGS